MRDDDNKLGAFPENDLKRSIFFQQAPRTPELSGEPAPQDDTPASEATGNESE